MEAVSGTSRVAVVLHPTIHFPSALLKIVLCLSALGPNAVCCAGQPQVAA